MGLSVTEGFSVPSNSAWQNLGMGPSRQNPAWDSGRQIKTEKERRRKSVQQFGRLPNTPAAILDYAVFATPTI